MTPCRAYWTLVALSVAFGALVTLALANRLLSALDAQREDERRALTRVTSDMETAWLIRDSAEKGYVFERDAAEMNWN